MSAAEMLRSLRVNTQQNFDGSHSPWAPAEGEWRGLESQDESLGFVALGGELKGRPPGSLC